jgi:hypothetical protein
VIATCGVLPSSGSVDATLLGRIFRNATTSYKFLFFGALLDWIQRDVSGSRFVPLRELVIGMVARAFHPAYVFRLSFGVRDQVANAAQSIFRRLPTNGSSASLERAILAGWDNRTEEQVTDLLRYVPFRLLRPWFSAHLEGKKDTEINATIKALAEDEFVGRRPLYRFAETESIEIHPDWFTYLRSNLSVIHGWAAWHWATYLSARNPNVPNIIQKLDAERKPLTWQRKYWDGILSESTFKCPYSGEELSPDNYALDHFLPWAFVAHDEIWNLCPVAPPVNARKSDQVPKLAQYLEQFVEIQYRGLISRRHGPADSLHQRAVEDIANGLRLTPPEVEMKSQLLAAYNGTVRPLADLAVRMGFGGDWVWH